MGASWRAVRPICQKKSVSAFRTSAPIAKGDAEDTTPARGKAGVISRVSLSLIMCTGGACRTFLARPAFSTACNFFQIVVCGAIIRRLIVVDDDAPLPVVL
jgi:hypothetical protein